MLGIVFVHYRLPEQRLRDHFTWNLPLYTEHEASLFVVMENAVKIPVRMNAAQYVLAFASTVAYTEPMPVFSLSATKNYGIQQAIAAGCDPIVTTDTDIAFTPESLAACAECGDKLAVVPIYRMARSHETREHVSHPDHGCGGTVCMTTVDWRRVQERVANRKAGGPYDERYIGYGGEDGKLRRDIAALGIHEQRETVVYHIAHNPSQQQLNIPGAGRNDCWNRDTGFNPDNWKENKKFYGI